MDEEFVTLVEREGVWARMLIEVLKDNGIPAAGIPLIGAGLTMRAGMQERYRVLVPEECLEKAAGILREIFPSDFGEPADDDSC